MRSSSKSTLLPTTIITISLRLRCSSIDKGGGTGESHPGLDIEIGLGVGDIVDNEHAGGALVVDLTE